MDELIFSNVISLLGGLALFLFGMGLMGDGLKQAAGDRMETVLSKLTSNPLKGVLLGTAVTAVIQSSSATSAMVVSFVNASMMTVRQAIPLVMGANIGTSVTGWILCLSFLRGSSGIAALLSITNLTAVVAVYGILLRMTAKSPGKVLTGNIILGFAVLMYGMQIMSAAAAPLRENSGFIGLITMFKNPVLGILIGIAFTAILQSNSASVGILQALSTTGAVTFAAAFPIVMGMGIGAAVPVLLSSVGTNRDGRRTALIYLCSDLFGTLIWSVVFYTANGFLHFSVMDMTVGPVSIALINTIFRIASIAVLLPCIRLLEALVRAVIPDEMQSIC